mmetsp:Transcript_53317/g.159053  ORF Transcript_53317/g.159053 Transcript_53317/m.159053 type:complete len:202 (+) Transcript_53317:98-703(+)
MLANSGCRLCTSDRSASRFVISWRQGLECSFAMTGRLGTASMGVLHDAPCRRKARTASRAPSAPATSPSYHRDSVCRPSFLADLTRSSTRRFPSASSEAKYRHCCTSRVTLSRRAAEAFPSARCASLVLCSSMAENAWRSRFRRRSQMIFTLCFRQNGRSHRQLCETPWSSFQSKPRRVMLAFCPICQNGTDLFDRLATRS